MIVAKGRKLKHSLGGKKKEDDRRKETEVRQDNSKAKNSKEYRRKGNKNTTKASIQKHLLTGGTINTHGNTNASLTSTTRHSRR